MPLHKKKDRKICDNYCGISLLSVLGMVLFLALLDRLETIIDPQLMESQCGFRNGQGTVDQIWVARQIVERATGFQTPVHQQHDQQRSNQNRKLARSGDEQK